MAEKKNLEEVIPICDKPVATIEEIMDGCGSVVKIIMGNKPKGEDVVAGLLSCSFSSRGLAVCIWQQKERGKFERVKQIAVEAIPLASLRGIIDLSLQRLVREHRGKV